MWKLLKFVVTILSIVIPTIRSAPKMLLFKGYAIPPTEKCTCLYQVQFGTAEENKVHLQKEHWMFNCSAQDDLYECRLLCAYEMMNKWTYTPHASGTAFSQLENQEVNIAEEACKLQKQPRVSVDVRYQLCENKDLKFLTFNFCCQMIQDEDYEEDPNDYESSETISDENLDKNKRQTEDQLSNSQSEFLLEDQYSKIHNWTYNPDNNCV